MQTALNPLPLGTIKPQGWLKTQLRIQADGQSGTLPDFWESLNEATSGWLGKEGESWERGPYYLDGLVPLAYLLDDEKLIARAKRWLTWAIESQRVDGNFGPKGLNDWWAYAPMLKALTQYQEASGDKRVIPMLTKFFAYMRENIFQRRPFVWAIYRWQDLAWVALWLHRQTGDNEALEAAKDLMALGYSWTEHFHEFSNTQKQALRFPMTTHVVNNAMGIKAPGVAWQITGWEEHKKAALEALQHLDTFHGTAAGVFTGDEHLAGPDPTQGTELCAVVEEMFSLEVLISQFADSAMADRLERIAFNALPATFDPCMTAHQYDQQANQVLCSRGHREWTNNGNDSNLFGVEPNFGCCTANFHQGWPKFASNLWMRSPDDGLAVVSYAPCEVSTVVRGVNVSLDVKTGYPFEELVQITVLAASPVTFPIDLRIPTWCEVPLVSVNGENVTVEMETSVRIEREWKQGDTILLAFPMAIHIERRFRDSATITRGPLVYALQIGEDWRPLEAANQAAWIEGATPRPDHEVYPTTPWNYALDLSQLIGFGRTTLPEVVFDSSTPPGVIHAKGRKVPTWVLEDNSSGPLPQSPVASSESLEDITLIPYGCAKLRITEFPVLE